MTKLIAILAASVVLAASSFAKASAYAKASADESEDKQTPVFRSGATLVPLDVRVLDRSGNPITDLKQSEFVITEDGRPQGIAHFSSAALTPRAVTDTPGMLRAVVHSDALEQQTHRVFLLVLGRGRLQPPSKGVDAMVQFVRERVLPQDQVAVLAWNRATDFTTNHAGLAELLGRFKAQHEKVENDLFGWFSGYRAVYGDKRIPPYIQKQIDEIFAAPGLRTAHTLITDPNERTLTNDELKKRADTKLRDELVADRPADKTMHDGLDPVSALGIGGSFEQFMASMMTTNQDISNLYAAVEYLRFIEGEKHLVFVTENGISLPDFSMEMAFASVANNARVVVDTIQTGGNFNASLVSSMTKNALPPNNAGFGPAFAIQSLRAISEQTGGISSVYSYADKAVKRIDEATRFGYLLGYYATNGVQDGRYRRVSVKVTRPGAQVLYRHGYYARAQTLPPNRRDMMSYTRMSTALTTGMNVYDIPLGFNTREEKDAQQLMLAMEITVGLAKLTPIVDGAVRRYTMELAVVAADREGKMVGQYSQRLDLALSDAQYQKAVKDGAPAEVAVRFPVTRQATNVKVVVYNFENDLLGSIVKKVR